ncbi:MAG TPA: 2OG-Fe(II) oxygenase [Dongiaceae bacterium]|jgi:peroxiredoxin/predicted 2-oxoglutarate/Fe(II)-dependent dioxygenase YbiX
MSERRHWRLPGDPAPWFQAPSNINPSFQFSSAAGRYIVLCFFGSGDDPAGRALIDGLRGQRTLFADPDHYCFGVSIGPRNRTDPDLSALQPGMDIFWDTDGAVSRLYGALPCDSEGLADGFQRVTYILGRDLRVVARILETDPVRQAALAVAMLRELPKPAGRAPGATQAPVLVLPDVFEPALCRRLIEAYDAAGGTESGYMSDRDGKTVEIMDHRHKRRSDWTIADPALKQATQVCIRRRVAPEIEKAFQFATTRMERYLVCCYATEGGGYFRPHRDNTTMGTAHRRFAVTVNLNTGDYTGGELTFPEFGSATFAPPPGGAVVFSCSLLHEALPVLSGKRYAFLPFLYDEAAAKLREANNPYLGDEITTYSADAGRRG